jgi:predicted methyltransferase MtxX (methanogen marker protein 4)
MDYKILSKVQEEKDKIIDLHKEIRDLEMELEFMHSREPDEVKYIMYLEKRIDALYEEADAIDGLNDEND